MAEKINEEKKFNVDEALKELEQINRQLADNSMELNDSLELYKKGVLLANECKAHLEGVEKELKIIKGM